MSILAAFALDALWDDAAMGRELRLDLASVSEEILENRDLIEFQVDLMDRMVVASDSMLSALDGAPEGSLVTLPDTVLWLTNTYTTLNASLGAVDALIASGRFALIEDPTLRAGLSGLREKFEDAGEEQHRVVAISQDHVMPFQATNPRWPIAAVARIGKDYWPAERVTGRQLTSYGTVEVPVSFEYSVFVRTRTTLHRNSVAEMRVLLTVLDSLMAKIELAM